MSGLTPVPLAQFRDALGARASSFGQLADLIGCGRSHVSQVLWGHRPGGETWPLIRAVVTDGEWELLLQMEHCATWNNGFCAEHGEAALVWRMRVRCATCKKPQGFKPCARRMAGRISDGICPECYPLALAEIARMPLPEAPESVERAYLVRTEAGLAVHRSKTRPALTDDRELSAAFVQGSAQSAPITSAIGDHPFLSRFNDETNNATTPKRAGD